MNTLAATSDTITGHPPGAQELTFGGRMRSIFSGSVGNLVEYFDWYVYAAFSLYFAPKFFPAGDQTAQLMNTAAVFAIGFLVRPLGGWLLGSYADRKGRKAALLVSVMLMCFGSLLIACIPGYDVIGFWAPALLLLARLLQGISLGGEYGSSATYISEMATPNRRGFYSSFQYVTIIMGQLLALGLLILLQKVFLTQEQLAEWGWRIPFFVGAVIALLAVWMRRNMAETESFSEHRANSKRHSNLRELARHPRGQHRLAAGHGGRRLVLGYLDQAYAPVLKLLLGAAIVYGGVSILLQAPPGPGAADKRSFSSAACAAACFRACFRWRARRSCTSSTARK